MEQLIKRLNDIVWKMVLIEKEEEFTITDRHGNIMSFDKSSSIYKAILKVLHEQHIEVIKEIEEEARALCITTTDPQ